MKNLKNNSGITLIALVVTIIVLLILAGVTINLVVGNNGIITRAKEAKEKTEQAAKDEQQGIAGLDNQINDLLNGNAFNEEKKVNSPKLVSGMSPIKFSEPTVSTVGSVQDTTTDDGNWYDYNQRKWANAKTQDGSMWVWIPRYAYKITYTNPSDKSAGGSIDVKFLIGTSDEYYAEDGSRKTAQRQTNLNQAIDTTADYTVHPAFTNESNIGYANGGWNKELTGIWIAKFEAGFPGGNNNTPNIKSNVDYTQTTSWVAQVELEGATAEGSGPARNWLDGIYGNTKTKISYPVFQPLTYSMNYINTNDAFYISRAMTDGGNIYGFNSSSSDSHLMKNSEWGAVAYLGWSKYGSNGVELAINNTNLNSENTKRTESTAGKTGVISIYAVTGCTSGSTNSSAITININELNTVTGNTATASGIYVWNQQTGIKASTTQNMTGIYDMSGGTWERQASYIANGNGNLKNYGKDLTYEGDNLKTENTPYVMVYPHDSDKDNSSISNIDDASSANYAKNTKIYGDGIRETSDTGIGSNSWNGDLSNFAGLHGPFFVNGGGWGDTSVTGFFCFHRSGGSGYSVGFRPVVVPVM